MSWRAAPGPASANRPVWGNEAGGGTGVEVCAIGAAVDVGTLVLVGALGAEVAVLVGTGVWVGVLTTAITVALGRGLGGRGVFVAVAASGETGVLVDVGVLAGGVVGVALATRSGVVGVALGRTILVAVGATGAGVVGVLVGRGVALGRERPDGLDVGVGVAA